jgi:hypothetical protein
LNWTAADAQPISAGVRLRTAVSPTAAGRDARVERGRVEYLDPAGAPASLDVGRPSAAAAVAAVLGQHAAGAGFTVADMPSADDFEKIAAAHTLQRLGLVDLAPPEADAPAGDAPGADPAAGGELTTNSCPALPEKGCTEHGGCAELSSKNGFDYFKSNCDAPASRIWKGAPEVPLAEVCRCHCAAVRPAPGRACQYVPILIQTC